MANANVLLAVQLNDAGAVDLQPMDVMVTAASVRTPVGDDLHAE